MTTRRGFITSALCLIAAPAIVRASSLMPVRAWKDWAVLTDESAWFMSPFGFHEITGPPFYGPSIVELIREHQERMTEDIRSRLFV